MCCAFAYYETSGVHKNLAHISARNNVKNPFVDNSAVTSGLENVYRLPVRALKHGTKPHFKESLASPHQVSKYGLEVSVFWSFEHPSYALHWLIENLTPKNYLSSCANDAVRLLSSIFLVDVSRADRAISMEITSGVNKTKKKKIH